MPFLPILLVFDHAPAQQLSKRLTYALRHGAEKMGLNLRPDGFVRLDELLSNAKFRGVTQQQVEDLVSWRTWVGLGLR